MNGGIDRHFAEEVWEEYAMGMRSEEDCRLLEEHLLVCSGCQDLLAEADEYIRAAKAALSRTPKALSKPATAAVALAVALQMFHLP